MTSTLHPAPVSTIQFTYCPTEKTFTAEASDLGRAFAFGRVWGDSCDEGLTLISHRTSREIVCVVEHVDTDTEGDIRFWRLAPVDAPAGVIFTVTIFND
jgi:hypothetical protein